MPSLSRQWQDFARHMSEIAISRGVASAPVFDDKAFRLVDGTLELDLLNIWHLSAQRTVSQTEELIENWISPQNLGHACCFGRVDVVGRHITKGLPLNGEDYGGNPIAAAIEAWVVTPLHVRCVELLIHAGAASKVEQFEAWLAESTGSEHDFKMLEMLIEHGRRSSDGSVRKKAASIDIDALKKICLNAQKGRPPA